MIAVGAMVVLVAYGPNVGDCGGCCMIPAATVIIVAVALLLLYLGPSKAGDLIHRPKYPGTKR